MIRNSTVLFISIIFLNINCTKDSPTSNLNSGISNQYEIAYAAWRSNGPIYDIYLYKTEDSTNTCLTNNLSFGGSLPEYSYDGLKIIFSDLNGIYFMDSDGSNVSNIIVDANVSDRFAVSMENHKIVYNLYYPSYSQDYSDLFIYDFNTRNGTKLTDSDSWVFSPKFIPYTTKIVYRVGNKKIVTTSYDGRDKSIIFTTELDVQNIDVSPNGAIIVFELENRYAPSHHMICKINTDGNNYQILTDELQISRSPNISPSGNKIVFVSESANDSNSDIYTMDINGSNKTNLTNSTEDEGSPRFSPDGKKIVFTSTINKWHTDIFIMDSDGKNKINLTNSEENDRNPVFRPNK